MIYTILGATIIIIFLLITFILGVFHTAYNEGITIKYICKNFSDYIEDCFLNGLGFIFILFLFLALSTFIGALILGQ